MELEREGAPDAMNRASGVVRSLQEGGKELLTFFQFPKSQWNTLRGTNVIERLPEEFRRRVKTQGSLPTEDAAPILLSVLWPVARSASDASMGGDRSQRCCASDGGRPHDARVGSRIPFDRRTPAQGTPEGGSSGRSTTAPC